MDCLCNMSWKLHWNVVFPSMEMPLRLFQKPLLERSRGGAAADAALPLAEPCVGELARPRHSPLVSSALSKPASWGIRVITPARQCRRKAQIPLWGGGDNVLCCHSYLRNEWLSAAWLMRPQICISALLGDSWGTFLRSSQCLVSPQHPTFWAPHILRCLIWVGSPGQVMLSRLGDMFPSPLLRVLYPREPWSPHLVRQCFRGQKPKC